MHVPRLAPFRAALLAGLLLGPLGSALPGGAGIGAEAAHAEPPVIYKWIDEHGVAHYTTDRSRIPSSIRDRVMQGQDASRHRDWLQRDAGDIDASAPAPAAHAESASAPQSSDVVPTPSLRQRADDVEFPEDSDGIHAVSSDPDWSQAPGGEAAWAPHDLGEGDGVAPMPSADPSAAPFAEPAPVPPVDAQPRAAAATPRVVPPPPPPPPLEADGAPIEAPASASRPDAAPAAAASRRSGAFGGESELPFDDPPAPASVAAPAPPALAPDERAKLEELDREIASIESEIARDEETLMVILSETDGVEQNTLVDDPRFRDVAQRLPRLQADLERLRERRARIQPLVTRQ